MEIIRQAVKNAQRHFIVWGALATIIMFAGIQENTSRSGHFDREPAPGTYAHVMENNVCEDSVPGEIPGAIVGYNLFTGGYFFSKSEDKIGKALMEEFDNYNWHGYKVRHFCK